MLNTILAKRVNHIVAKGDNPAWPKGSKSRGFSNDNLIKALCTFKEIPVKGKLYSTMFNQSFSADGAVCSLKEDKEGRFDLKIDGVSHHSWFRRKKDEFMEALGLPTSRSQNRGLKL